MASESWLGKYSIGDGKDVLIIYEDPPSHPEAVPRRSGKLTAEFKKILQQQGIPPKFQNELAIITARFAQDKRFKIFAVKSGKLSREEVMDNIRDLLITTKNDGGRITCRATLLEHFYAARAWFSEGS